MASLPSATLVIINIKKMSTIKIKWCWVYIIKCSDSTLYTGITTNLKRRLEEHNHSPLGAKYTHGRRPVKLVYSKKFKNKSLASKEEARIKKLSRKEKSKATIIPKVEKVVDLYRHLSEPKEKNDLLKEVLEKVIYTKEEKGRRFGKIDGFELELYPKIPK